MKQRLILTLAAFAFTSPAFAVEFTNLDHREHRVLYEHAGTREVITLAPGATERAYGPNGTVSLLEERSGKKKKASSETLHSDGMLSGIVGAARSSNIPADSDDVFVIWEDGTFGLQQSRRQSRQGR